MHKYMQTASWIYYQLLSPHTNNKIKFRIISFHDNLMHNYESNCKR